MRKPVQIDADVHRKVGQEAKEQGLSFKEYAEQSLLFFANRSLNPATYSPGQTFDLLQVMKKSTDRIISFIVHQEQTLLSDITEEVLRNRLYQDALILLLVEKVVLPEEQGEKLREITAYVEKRIKAVKKK